MDNELIIAVGVAILFGAWLALGIIDGDKEAMSKQMRAHIDKQSADNG